MTLGTFRLYGREGVSKYSLSCVTSFFYLAHVSCSFLKGSVF